MVTAQSTATLPPIGKPDPYYLHAIAEAEQAGDLRRRSALKVARYISLALKHDTPWEEQLHCFTHVLRHHCVPTSQDEETIAFYNYLSDLVRQYAGAQALMLASQEDDIYAARAQLGQERDAIEDDAEIFFAKLLGNPDQRPDHFNEVDWAQLKLIHDQWL